MQCWGIKLKTSYMPGDPLHQLSYTASLSGILALACTCNFKMKNTLGTVGGPLVPSRAKSPGRWQCLQHHSVLSGDQGDGNQAFGVVSLKTEYSSRSEIKGQRHRAEGTKGRLHTYLTLERPEAVIYQPSRIRPLPGVRHLP